MNASQNKFLKNVNMDYFHIRDMLMQGFICFIYLDKLSQDSDWEGRF